MALQQYVVRILVASPSDVADERAILEDVVREFNKTWSKQFGLRFDLLAWETDGFPAAGDDPQSILNQQLGDDYDIFLGVLWAKFGTPTPRAPSGTIEEFERAHRRYLADSNAISVMVYFSEEKISPAEVNPEDLARVQAFRASLGARGVLWWSYSGRDAFAQILRTHLARQAQDWKRRLDSPPSMKTVERLQVEVAAQQVREDPEDEGLLDLLEAIQDDIASLTRVTERIAAATTEVGSQLQARAAEMDSLRQESDPPDLRKAKRVVTQGAQDMRSFATRLEADTPEFAETYGRLIDRLTRLALLQAESSQSGSEVARQTVEGVGVLLRELTASRDGILKLRDVVSGTPRMTTELNKARRQTVDVLDRLAGEFDKGITLASESVAPLRRLVE